MATDPALIAALEEAVDRAPGSHELRRHLVAILLDAGRFDDARRHLDALIAHDPADAKTRELAARAAEGASVTGAIADASLAAPDDADPGPNARAVGREPARLRVIRGGSPLGATKEVDDARITLKDVAGMEQVKRRLELAFLAPMRNPEMRRLYGKRLRGGLLLYGPPGCGKTFVAKAVAGELGAQFIAIGLQDVLDMWLGNSERNVHEIFERARASAPSVLFFDEIDALGRKRSLMRGSSERPIVNQLLAELDNVKSDNEGLFVLAATNHPWDVDSALRRPGRLDRTILVLPPDRSAREAILRAQLTGRPAESVDIAWLAATTDGFSGADLVHVCDVATEQAMDDSLKTGVVRPIETKDFRAALRDVRPSVGAWFSTARNYAEFANEGGVFDELVDYLRTNRSR